jgi:peptidoglycan/LPS O-acetylase OafA/YrhL
MIDGKSPAMNDQDQRYDHFQIMRGIACLMVFFNHAVGLLTRNLNFNGAWYEPLVVPLGFPWVWLFLILSGFLLTKQFVEGRAALSAQGIFRFYQRRCQRLLPMLWFAPVLWMICYYSGLWSPDLPAFMPHREISIALALPWLPYVESGNPIASVNSPVWSAVLEIHYFLLLPLVLWCARMSVRLIVIAVAAWLVGIAILALHVGLTHSPTVFPMIYQQHLYNCGFVLAGCALGLSKRMPYRISWFWPILAVTATIVVVQYSTAYDLNLTLALMPIVALPAFSFLVLQGNSNFQSPVPCSARELGFAQGPLRWVELVGMMSYSIYLLHKPLSYIAIGQIGLDRWVSGIGSLACATFVTAAAITPVILLSYAFVEIRFRRQPTQKLSLVN